jgi:hypothetical protein
VTPLELTGEVGEDFLRLRLGDFVFEIRRDISWELIS